MLATNEALDLPPGEAPGNRADRIKARTGRVRGGGEDHRSEQTGHRGFQGHPARSSHVRKPPARHPQAPGNDPRLHGRPRHRGHPQRGCAPTSRKRRNTLRAGSFASSDNPGPFEVLGAQAYYYVTPTEAEWPDKEKDEWLTSFNYYTADIVSVHEVYPGHYVQALRNERLAGDEGAADLRFVRVHRGLGRTIASRWRWRKVSAGRKAAVPNDLQGAKYHLAQSDESPPSHLSAVAYRSSSTRRA